MILSRSLLTLLYSQCILWHCAAPAGYINVGMLVLVSPHIGYGLYY